MDYAEPIEAVIPGVQGRVLGVVARTRAELSMRTVARLAGVSPNRATSVLNHLVKLGLIERRDVGTSAMVRLVEENEASRAISALARLTDAVVDRLRTAAKDITPAPVSLVVFGSFARGHAREDSDVDVLVVRPDGVPSDDTTWVMSLGKWSDLANRIVGNPVNLILASQVEMPHLVKQDQSVWAEIVRDGLTLQGVDIQHLGLPA